MKRKASAVWNGDLVSGKGTMSGPSGVLSKTPYSFKTRFEEPVTGTNPEELIAAALAGCFSMAFSHDLASADHTPEQVATDAELDLEQIGGGFSITRIHLAVKARVPGIDEETFQRIARATKEGCPVSRALKVEITMDARLDA